MAGYAKYYSYGNTKLLESSEFTRGSDHCKRIFFGHW